MPLVIRVDLLSDQLLLPFASVEIELEVAEVDLQVLDTKLRETVPLRDGYFIEVRRATHEWGASADLVAALLEMWSTVDEFAAGAVVGEAVRRLIGWAESLLPSVPLQRPPLEDAIDLARWRVGVAFAANRRDLRVIREEEVRDPLGWRLMLEDARGVRFSVDVLGTKAGEPVTYVTADWSALGGAPERGVPTSIASRYQ